MRMAVTIPAASGTETGTWRRLDPTFASNGDESPEILSYIADDANYITGQVIYVDGGITIQLSPPGQPL